MRGTFRVHLIDVNKIYDVNNVKIFIGRNLENSLTGHVTSFNGARQMTLVARRLTAN